MSYNLGAQFGLNVTTRGGGQQGFGGSGSQETFQNIFKPAEEDFLTKYEDVFNGNVEHEINLYSRQSMIVAMNMRASDTNVRRFDMKI